ncbi:hypothetical protein K4A83_13885 [Spirulina subsalsa FACHB-351]|uniref:Uncharacterized protein n=1 Tax=Spirulina subsalsa FACHB-351 TaxID=234711 RepID=A0ABT3L778_9CYAN|nr:hypothetical protein [Spirulina subsalsa]MCW6037354.1 hypothetical protein [Spirulina subsalsa FACHB-351]
MVSQSTRQTALFLGLAGTFALGVAPAAQAQIPVTGGSIQGEAAFFIPSQNPEGNVSLFDIGINQLRIVSPNGVLTNPNFIPTGSYFDDGGNGKVNAGDTGLLQGQLSGVAFNGNGFLVPFSRVDTILSFKVGFFDSNPLNVPGTLIRPEVAAPQLFLPYLSNVQGTGFTPTEGKLQIGQIDANIDNGLIDLPSDYRFVQTAGATLPEVIPIATQKIKFEFEGKDVTLNRGGSSTSSNTSTSGTSTSGTSTSSTSTSSTSTSGTSTSGTSTSGTSNTSSSSENQLATAQGTDLDYSDGSLRVSGEATKFKIESVGGGSRNKFKIEGSGAIDFAMANLQQVGDVTEKNRASLDLARSLNYKIDGQASGYFALLNSTATAFSGSNLRGDKPVEFKVKQDSTNFELDGKFRGDIQFLTQSGVGEVNVSRLSRNYKYENLAGNPTFLALRNAGTEVNVNFLTVNQREFKTRDVFKVGRFSFNVLDGGKIKFEDVKVEVTPASVEFEQQERISNEIKVKFERNNRFKFNPAIVNIFTGRGGRGRFLVLGSPIYFVNQTAQVDVQFGEVSGVRYLVASRGRGRGLALGYKLRGPSSRAFPSLVGLSEISQEEAESIYDQLAADEDDLDFGADVDDDTDLDVDDDDDLDVDDDEVEVDDDDEVEVDDDAEVEVDDDAEVEVDDDAEVEVDDDAEVEVDDDAEVEVDDDAEVEVDDDAEVEVDDEGIELEGIEGLEEIDPSILPN